METSEWLTFNPEENLIWVLEEIQTKLKKTESTSDRRYTDLLQAFYLKQVKEKERAKQSPSPRLEKWPFLHKIFIVKGQIL